jgi:hypothetical protein
MRRACGGVVVVAVADERVGTALHPGLLVEQASCRAVMIALHPPVEASFFDQVFVLCLVPLWRNIKDAISITA